MKNNIVSLPEIPKEKFAFANTGDRISDEKFEDKPIGYFKDAWNRFRKNKASIVASIVILIILLYAFIVPYVGISEEMDTYYQEKGPRVSWMTEVGVFDGGKNDSQNAAGFINLLALGMAAEDKDGSGVVSFKEGQQSEYQPIIKSLGYEHEHMLNGTDKFTYHYRVDEYLAVGFLNLQVSQDELKNIEKWQKESGVQVLYPLINDHESSPYFWHNNPDPLTKANF